MGSASLFQHSFLGGEWSASMQGRIDRPDYRTAMNVCLNMLPIEQGALVRRPGTQFAQLSRSGSFAREIKFEFEAAAPYRIEFTSGHMRFRVGNLLVPEPEQQTVLSQTNTAPVVLELSAPPFDPFTTGDDIYFPGSVDPLIRNRLFRATVVDQTHLFLTDPVTGAGIEPAINFVDLEVYRVFDVLTPYTSQAALATLRLVQAEERAILLTATVAPTILEALANPAPGFDSNGQPFLASFAFESATFLDGPYMDPIPGGARITPSALTGVITLTVSFPPYGAGTAYTVGDFVASAGVDYESLIDANVGNLPAISATAWKVVSTGIAVGPNGFVGSDVGRLIRLLSQPAPWAIGTAYIAGNEVTYPNGVNGGVTYWRCLAGNTGVVPGTNATDWAIDANGAVWTWGKIVSLGNFIDPAGSTPVGSMGAIAASFDGDVAKSSGACSNVVTGGTTIDAFVGLQMGVAQAFSTVTVYPSTDKGFAQGTIFFSTGGSINSPPQFTINLRGNNAAPGSPSDGTLLGTSNAIANNLAAVTIASNDTTTAYNYLWVEVVSNIFATGVTVKNEVYVAQVEFFSAVAAGVANAVHVEILGGPLLYTVPILVWQLGLFSNTTGYPTSGVYHEGRIWFSGVLGNRVDASVSNGVLQNGKINMAPTNPDGSIGASNGISYQFNADDINPIFWMVSDQVGIICGTQGGEWLVQASNLNSPLSPTNMQAKRFSGNRCADIEPRGPGPISVVQFYQQKLLEFFSDVYSGRMTAQNLAWKSPQLTAPKLAELAFMHERAPVMWARRLDGFLIGLTYKRENMQSSQEPNFAAGHRHALGSGRVTSGICEASTADGSLSTVSLVTVGADGIYHIELLTNILLDTDNPANAWHVDEGVIPAISFLTPTAELVYGGAALAGLWHLNGATVSVYAGGLDCGDYLVSNGSVTVPFGDGISGGTAGGLFTRDFANTSPQIVVGYNFLSQAQIVRPILPVESGARNGPALGKKRRVHKYAMLVANTAGLFIGTTFAKLFPVQFKSLANVPLKTGQFFNGIYKDTLSDDYSYDGMLCFEVTRPFPVIIAAVEAFLETQDE